MQLAKAVAVHVRVGLPAYPAGQVKVMDPPFPAGPKVPIKSTPVTTSVPMDRLSAQQPSVQALRVNGLISASQHIPEHVTLWLATPGPQLVLQLPKPNPVHTSGYGALVQLAVDDGSGGAQQPLGQVTACVQVPVVLSQSPVHVPQVPTNQAPLGQDRLSVSIAAGFPAASIHGLPPHFGDGSVHVFVLI